MKLKLALGLLLLAISSYSLAEESVATVNGKPISKKTFDAYVKYKMTKNPNFDIKKDRQLVINELVDRELMYQDALKQGLDKVPEIIYQIEQQRINLLIKHAMRESLKDKQISEADMKAEYENQIKQAELKEFKASHVLLKTEDEAKNVIKELEKGRKIADLAKAYSVGPTAKNGGDLGWFSSSQMVAPFAEAVAKLTKGNYTKKPVQTKFGWHVIYLEDARNREPPAYDTVKRQLAIILKNKQVKEYAESLRKNAKIKVK